MNKIDVIGLGALNLDYVYRVERILEDGETVVREAAAFPGGSAANTIYGLARLGVSTGFTGAVGDDAEGGTLVDDLKKAGVDTGGVSVKAGAPTGRTTCLSDMLGRRAIYVLPGANNLLAPNDLDRDAINRAKMLHVSSFADEKQLRLLLELAGWLDDTVRLSFAPGAIYAALGVETLKPILKRTHVLFLNRDEMRQLTGDDITSGAEICLEHGCHTVVVTLGAATGEANSSSYIMSAHNEYLVAAAPPDSEPVDTTGAGDAYAAGFLYGLLHDKDLEACGQMGDTVARGAIGRAGARPGLPDLKTLSRRYRELYGRAL